MSRYTIETLMNEIEQCMKDNLNTKIAAINTEMDDSIVLDSIEDDAYCFQSLDEKVMNYDPFVFYGLGSSVKADAHGPMVSKTLPVDIVILSFDANKPDIGKRALRYNRALEEIFLEKWDRACSGGIKLKVIAPVLLDFTLLNSSDTFRAVGVELEAVIA